ncbi:MAG: hypothetical protein AB1Z29_24515, partial [Desulfobacterales bacterium]
TLQAENENCRDEYCHQSFHSILLFSLKLLVAIQRLPEELMLVIRTESTETALERPIRTKWTFYTRE